MKIRKIELSDANEFLRMLKQLDKETQNMMFEPEERTSSQQDIEKNIIDAQENESIIFIVEENNQIIGFLTAERGFANRIKHSAYIVVGILKKYRGRSIGKSLFIELDKWAIESGIKRLELTVMVQNQAGIKLYEKMGFEIEGIKKMSMFVEGNFIDEYYMAKIF